MNVLITGSRTWEDVETMRQALVTFPRDTQFIHGGARGADVLSSLILEELGFPEPHVVRPEYDYWTRIYSTKIGKNGFPYGQGMGRKIAGRIAPLKRNELMLDGKTQEEGPVDASLLPDLVLSFFMNEKETGGTAACVKEARKRGIPVQKIIHP